MSQEDTKRVVFLLSVVVPEPVLARMHKLLQVTEVMKGNEVSAQGLELIVRAAVLEGMEKLDGWPDRATLAEWLERARTAPGFLAFDKLGPVWIPPPAEDEPIEYPTDPEYDWYPFTERYEREWQESDYRAWLVKKRARLAAEAAAAAAEAKPTEADEKS
jgi:hypothetical protein